MAAIWAGMIPLVSSANAADTPAGSGTATAANSFGRFDRDGDARLSEEEVRNGMADIYASYDKNGDESLSADELPQVKGADGKNLSDGAAVLIEDLMGEVATIFGTLDSDGDGFVSSTEFSAAGITPAAAQ
jgi:Ca2+-binding EF-hand superfamily protein